MIATSGPFKGLNPTVAGASLTIVAAFVAFGALFTGTAGALFPVVRDLVLAGFKWYYIAIVAFVLAFVVWLGFGGYKNVRLGGDDERPQFAYFSWFSMLFAAGMGIGLIFWGVAEPLSHFRSNPFSPTTADPAAAVSAMRLSFFHWGLSAWGVYALVGLTLAYFAYRRRLPLTIRSSLHPIVGEGINHRPGHVVDVLAVFGTAFGVATSLGLGVQQMATGLGRIASMEVDLFNQLLILAGATGAATLSVVSGVRRGVRWLSNLNLILSAVFLGLFLVAGPTVYLLDLLVQATGDYLQNLVGLSFWTNTGGDSGWQEEWTLFYWGWWIAWSPFVGMFIARISQGRTVREFVIGVLLVPALLTFAWLALTGGTALHMELAGRADLLGALNRDVSLPLFATLDGLDLGALELVATGLVTLLIATYFVTSCDSGTLVITTILSAGAEEPPIAHRVLWGLGEGLLAAVLLAAGGLAALQAAAIAAGLPFAFILAIMAYGLVKALRDERFAPREGVLGRHHCDPWTGCTLEPAPAEGFAAAGGVAASPDGRSGA